jgi:predicted DNA repair protein MutK
MASGLFALLDDVAMLMDDVAVMTKVAGKKTAGILGDDLAVNAEKATGFEASRELPVLWAITKGSFLNKLIILPVAFGLSAFAPWVIEPILIAGGLFLAYEGAEKVVHVAFHRGSPKTSRQERPPEKERIRSAVLVDFILSVEIVVIALGEVMDADLEDQIAAVTAIALLATVGVYGLVALLVRMDDAGLALMKRSSAFARRLGRFLVAALPVVIKVLSVLGTAALLLVSGGIFHHHIPGMHHVLHDFPALMADAVLGLGAGLAVLGLVRAAKAVFR